MIKTLRESKAKLSSLVERASRGEDVLITVRGQVKARLTRAETPGPSDAGKTWAEELRTLQRSMRVPPKPRLTVEHILAEQREDRF
jgi:prevent-host-death family protein